MPKVQRLSITEKIYAANVPHTYPDYCYYLLHIFFFLFFFFYFFTTKFYGRQLKNFIAFVSVWWWMLNVISYTHLCRGQNLFYVTAQLFLVFLCYLTHCCVFIDIIIDKCISVCIGRDTKRTFI